MLSLLSAIYGKVADIRNKLYDKGIFESHDLGARVISIGNITTGGTGKTPLVAYVANILAKRGEKVCILTRGYGRKDPKNRVLVSDGENILATAVESGDEPFELANKLLGKAIVIADADRVAAAEWAKRRFGVTAFILDDGFQHRKAKRNVDIVCIDATNPFGGGKMVPAGRLREPLHNLSRADILIITRSDLIKEDRLSRLRSELEHLNPHASVFQASTTIDKIVRLTEFEAEMTRLHQVGRTLAFCGLGNPQSFFSRLKLDGIELVGEESFRDHHYYKQQDAEKLDRLAAEFGAKSLITTAKDAVKLSGLEFAIPYYVVEIKLVLDNPVGFAAMI